MFNVDENPSATIDVDGKELKIPRDLSEVELAGFEKSTLTIDGKEQTVFTLDKMVLIYLLDESDQGEFYRLDSDQQVIGVWNPMVYGEVYYLPVAIGEEEQERAGMLFGKQEVLTQSVDGWSFLNEELSHLRLIKLSNLNEEENFYLYDVEEETVEIHGRYN